MKIVLFFVVWANLLAADIHIIGDSHTFVFRKFENCIVHYTPGRTMHRVGRDGLGALNFRDWGIQENDFVVLINGEIDVRAHVGKQRDLKNRDLNEILDTLANNYFSTILLNKALYENIHIIVYTVVPPSPLLPEYDHADHPAYGSIEERVAICKMLNSKLKASAETLGIGILDIYDDYADANGVLIHELSDGIVHINDDSSGPIREKLDQLVRSHLASGTQ